MNRSNTRFLYKVAKEVNQTILTLSEFLVDDLSVKIPKNKQALLRFSIGDNLYEKIIIKFAADGQSLAKLHQEQKKQKLAEEEQIEVEKQLQKEKEDELVTTEILTKPKKTIKTIKTKLKIIKASDEQEINKKIHAQTSSGGLKIIKDADANKIIQQDKLKIENKKKNTQKSKVTYVRMQDIQARVDEGLGKKKILKKYKDTKKLKPQEKFDTAKSVKKILSDLASKKSKKKQKRSSDDIDDSFSPAEEKISVDRMGRVKVSEFLSVDDLAQIMSVKPNEVIQKCLLLGNLVTINQRLDRDTIELVADEFRFDVEFIDQTKEEESVVAEEYSDEEMELCPPVITIMGHVDHGKTSLLDFIRKTNVVGGESGGITQHIGAYEIEIGKNKRQITFLDTPGHKAFTAMRARGASVTDIVVIVVAADDGVMPQTIEAISHAKSAGVPIIFSITKIDKSNADIEKVKRELSENKILIEEWGGAFQCSEISSKNGDGISDLMDKILIESDMLEKKANPNGRFRGIIIESKLDKGLGAIATILVKQGTLLVGQPFLCGAILGKVRALVNERGQRIKEVMPGLPIQVLGFPEVPTAGEQIVGYDDEKQAKQIAQERQRRSREIAASKFKTVKTLDQLSIEIREGQTRELPIVLKGDTDGSIEAIADSLHQAGNDEVKINLVHKGVGSINESDILLACASSAVVIGFHVSTSANASLLAKTENIDIRIYNVIYDLIDELTKALEGLLEPNKKTIETGTVEVRLIFKSSKIGKIAGCFVTEGKIERKNTVCIYRDGQKIHDGIINALKRFKDDVAVVESGFECGITVNGFEEFKEGDIIKPYLIEKTKRKLEQKKD